MRSPIVLLITVGILSFTVGAVAGSHGWVGVSLVCGYVDWPGA